MPPRRSLDQYADDRAKARFAENQEQARKLRVVTAELGELIAAHHRLQDEFEAIDRIYREAVALTPQPDWLIPTDTTKHGRRLVTPVVFLSDPHVGEVVRPEEMNGYNAYNLRIADLRLRAFFENAIELARRWAPAYEYDGIVLVLGGDMVSGSIHDELRQTDELSVLDSAIWLAPRLIAGVERLAEEFGRVHVVSVPGNHGRDSQKPRYKRRSAHNADTHVARMAALAWHGDGVTWHIPETIDARFTVHGWRFNGVHGEEYQKNNPGTSEIGSIGPVKRGTMRTARAADAEGDPFQFNLVAHFHQLVYAPSQGFVMNGSIKGWDEYARSLSLKPEPPQQAWFIVDPEHGPTVHAPILLRNREAEGW